MVIEESDLYYYDEAAAERAVKFIEKYCHHYEDRWAGSPFILLPFQRKIVTDIFGWKRRKDNLRRFREVFLEMPKGNGKSPLITSIGMVCLFADHEEGALVISAATDFQQANVTFDCAKKMIEQSPKLAQNTEVKQYVIEAPKNSAWRIVSGNESGKAGTRPTCLVMDEAWEWHDRRLYDSLTRNARKRSQPLVLVATNSGHRKDSICWELHERAQRVLDGTSRDDTLYPVIYCSDPTKDDPGSEELWAKMNPALDQIITTETLRQEWTKAKEVPALEAEFRRLHVGQWVEGSNKHYDMAQWDACTKPFSSDLVKDLPLVMGLDMSLNDDLTALSLVWVGSDRLYVKSKFWLPRQTAYRYEDKAGIPYTTWAKNNHIKLIESETIDPATQKRLARFIIDKLAKRYQLKAVCYDPAKASNLVALLEEAGVVCPQIKQGFGLSASIEELDRRLKDKSIQFYPNDVMRFCASNCETKSGDMGGVRLVKPGAEGKYKGNKNYKIDGVAALVTALHQVRLMEMQPAAQPSVYESRGIFIV